MIGNEFNYINNWPDTYKKYDYDSAGADELKELSKNEKADHERYVGGKGTLRERIAFQGGDGIKNKGEYVRYGRGLDREELLRLSTFLWQVKKKERGIEEKFECYVLDGVGDEWDNEWDALDAFVSNIFNHIPEKGNLRIFMIFKIAVPYHYTALYFNLTSNKKELLILDAAGECSHEKIPERLDDYHFDQIYATEGKIQKDSRNCGVYAFQALKQCFKKKDLFDFLDKNAEKTPSEYGFRTLHWSKFPPDFLKCAQCSNSDLKRLPWVKNVHYKETTLYDYIVANTAKINGKYRNNEIEKKLSKITQLALGALKIIPEEKVIKIVTANPIQLFLNNHGFSLRKLGVCT